MQVLTHETASAFARLVLAGIGREYPHKLDHVMDSDGDVLPPRALHPVFFGCFDWHSAVHGHWLLARLLRLLPDLPEAAAIRAALSNSLTPEKIAGEVAYLARPNSGSFERTYGWAWLLKLAEELERSAGGAEAEEKRRQWAAALAPLAAAFVERYLAYLPKLDYPIRTGVHANTAFGLMFAHDYAALAGRTDLRGLVEHKALAFYARDENYPAHFEPGGADFFSPALLEAALMRRVLPAGPFAAWLRRFLPGLAEGQPRALFEPARVSDRADLQIVHLDGLNLSRAWCMRNIAQALPPDDSARAVLEEAASRHIEAGAAHVCSGSYAGEHWLATFAVLALTGDA